MKERNSQFIIFGDYRSITPDDIVDKLSDVRKENELEIRPSSNIERNAFFTFLNSATMVFQSKDDNELFVFMPDRIFFQMWHIDINNHNHFISKGVNLLRDAINALHLEVKRIAMNGSFIDYPNDDVATKYPKLFNPESSFYDEHSEQWEFMTNKQEDDTTLNCKINNIVRIIRDKEIIGLDGTKAGPMVVTYDCNTMPEDNTIFNAEALEIFANIASQFREKVLEI